MRRADWLLLFIAYEGSPDGLDPVRLQKGMFLFAQEASVRRAEKYDFVPYNYGPMSRAIYGDLDAMADRALIQRVPVEGQSWSRFKVTDSGVAAANRILDRAMQEAPEAAQYLYATKATVNGKSFDALL